MANSLLTDIMAEQKQKVKSFMPESLIKSVVQQYSDQEYFEILNDIGHPEYNKYFDQIMSDIEISLGAILNNFEIKSNKIFDSTLESFIDRSVANLRKYKGKIEFLKDYKPEVKVSIVYFLGQFKFAKKRFFARCETVTANMNTQTINKQNAKPEYSFESIKSDFEIFLENNQVKLTYDTKENESHTLITQLKIATYANFSNSLQEINYHNLVKAQAEKEYKKNWFLLPELLATNKLILYEKLKTACKSLDGNYRKTANKKELKLNKIQKDFFLQRLMPADYMKLMELSRDQAYQFRSKMHKKPKQYEVVIQRISNDPDHF